MRRVLVLGLLLAALAMPDVGLGWSWPVDGVVLRGFSLGADPYAGGQHRGIDIAATDGDPVRAPAAGKVSFAGMVPGRGKTVSILTDTGFAVTLSHLGDSSVTKGQSIEEGVEVGRAGRSGTQDHADPYVQLGIRDASDPNGYRDPLAFLPARALPEAGPQETVPAAVEAVPAADPGPGVDPPVSPAPGLAEPASQPEPPAPASAVTTVPSSPLPVREEPPLVTAAAPEGEITAAPEQSTVGTPSEAQAAAFDGRPAVDTPHVASTDGVVAARTARSDSVTRESPPVEVSGRIPAGRVSRETRPATPRPVAGSSLAGTRGESSVRRHSSPTPAAKHREQPARASEHAIDRVAVIRPPGDDRPVEAAASGRITPGRLAASPISSGGGAGASLIALLLLLAVAAAALVAVRRSASSAAARDRGRIPRLASSVAMARR